jgi:hypothetical protein
MDGLGTGQKSGSCERDGKGFVRKIARNESIGSYKHGSTGKHTSLCATKPFVLQNEENINSSDLYCWKKIKKRKKNGKRISRNCCCLVQQLCCLHHEKRKKNKKKHIFLSLESYFSQASVKLSDSTIASANKVDKSGVSVGLCYVVVFTFFFLILKIDFML